jgi:hypothetical protein
METGSYSMSGVLFPQHQKTQTELDAELVDKVREGTKLFQTLVPSLLGGYHQLRADAAIEQNWEKVAYYDGLIAGVSHTHNHWIELMK